MAWIRASAEYSAPPAEVWRVLADWPAYPSWNPLVVSLEGEQEPGAALVIELELPDGAKETLRPTLLTWEEGAEFSWLGRLPLGAFNGRHVFRVEPAGTGGTLFTHEEEFTGWLTGPVLRFIGDKTRAGFEEMNRALGEAVASG